MSVICRNCDCDDETCNCPPGESDFDLVDEDLECMNDDGTCKGEVALRMPLSGTGKSFPRCEHHWELRLKEQDRINTTYGPDSDLPPSWFHGSWGGTNDCGERWDDD